MAEDKTVEMSEDLLEEVEMLSTTPCLIVMAGPQKGALYSLSEGTWTLGRAPEKADIVLTGRGISRAHARVEVTKRSVNIVDLGSTNGLFVNGEKVAKRELRAGDTVSLGSGNALRMSMQDPAVQQLMTNLYKGATLDDLTGVLNRKSFEARAEAEDSQQACIVLVEVDDFATLGEKHGEADGQELLKNLATQFRLGLAKDGFVGRFAPHQFALMVRRAPRATAILLEGIRLGVSSSRFRLQEELVEMTFSAGVAPMKADLETAFSEAQTALQKATGSGGNRIAIAMSK